MNMVSQLKLQDEKQSLDLLLFFIHHIPDISVTTIILSLIFLSNVSIHPQWLKELYCANAVTCTKFTNLSVR